MNSETGIITQKDLNSLSNVERAKHIPIDEQLMTFKQKQAMAVSRFDNRSALGKIRIKHRNSLRNQPCPCGSKIKFKKCCWSKTC